MDILKKYEVAFHGLKEGRHTFEFLVNKEFFENYTESIVSNGSLKVTVSLEKSSMLLVLDFTIKGEVELPCDRCLDLFMLPLYFKGKLFVKFGETNEELSDDVLVLNTNEHSLNIAQYIYENIHLSLPYKRIHPDLPGGESGCNPEMLNKLNELIIHDTLAEPNDSRWDQLKGLLNNKKTLN